MTPEEVLEMVYDLGRRDEFHNTDTWDDIKANALAAIERIRVEDKISVLKKIKSKRPNAELDDQTNDYLRGYHEVQSKIGFEIQRLQSKLEEK